MSIFEALMLIFFGAAWPISIVKSWKSRTTKGKSLVFLVIVELGYIAGIIHKYFYSMDIVIFIYIINFTMVFIDLLLFLRNRRIDILKQEQVSD
ncbi:MAG: hypothetical protein FWE72_07650 [Spirochaetaceae bacterium]|nr:hypothetical protein [Spirochaetaceae bacterium]